MFKRILLVFLIMFAIVNLNGCFITYKAQDIVIEDGTEKYNNYVKLSNTLNEWLNGILDAYFKEFGVEEDINIPKDYDKCGTMPIIDSFYKQVDEAVEYASKNPSFKDADESMKILAPKIKALMDTMNEIYNYYSQKEFLEDNGVMGTNLHRKIRAQYVDYLYSLDKFGADLDVIGMERLMQELKELKEDDMLIRYHGLNLLMEGEKIQALFYDESMMIDIKEFEEIQILLIEHIDKFLEYVDDDNRLKKEGLDQKIFLGRAIDDCRYLKTSACEMLEILNELDQKNNYTGVVSMEEVELYIYDYNSKFSSMISSYNNLNYEYN
ncbi:MAG: YiiG family protein [Peptostreptococcaceae bacterium]|nr:YiiG family protein [Peptostreptococcaceae bacterium]